MGIAKVAQEGIKVVGGRREVEKGRDGGDFGLDESVKLGHAGYGLGLGDESAAEDTKGVAGLGDLDGVIDI